MEHSGLHRGQWSSGGLCLLVSHLFLIAAVLHLLSITAAGLMNTMYIKDGHNHNNMLIQLLSFATVCSITGVWVHAPAPMFFFNKQIQFVHPIIPCEL